MRQVVISRHGTPDVLEVREGPDPTPAAGEVRIRVRAAGINFADVLARLGLYPDAPHPPCVVGYEVAGAIDAVGASVTGFHPRRPCRRADPLWRLRRRRHRPNRPGLSLSRSPQRRRSGGGPGQLPDRGARALSHGGADAGRNRADSQRRRRRRHCGDPARPAAPGRRARHRIRRQARGAQELRRRAHHRLPRRRRGAGREGDHQRARRRRHPRSDRRPQLSHQLPHARAARAADHLRPLVGRARRTAQRAAGVHRVARRTRVSIRCR